MGESIGAHRRAGRGKHSSRVGQIIAEIEETNRWFYGSLVKYGQRTEIFDSHLDSNEAGARSGDSVQRDSGKLVTSRPHGYDLERLTDSMIRVVLMDSW